VRPPAGLRGRFVPGRKGIVPICVCGEEVRRGREYLVDVPDTTHEKGEFGFAKFDGRPKGPAGWRIGVSGNGARKFARMKRVVMCEGCALMAQIQGDAARARNEMGAPKIASWPGKEHFENRRKFRTRMR
jgi:hypothetical protein